MEILSGWWDDYFWGAVIVAKVFVASLSLMILFGFLTRFAALGLVVMTLVIQYVYPDFWWSSHAYWLVILLYLVRNGGGQVSVDRFLCGNKA